MKVNLNAYDRLVIRNMILPQKSDYTTMILCKDIENKIEITPEEIELIFLRDNNGKLSNLKIEEAKELVKQIELTNLEKNLLKDEFKKLDEKKEISKDILDLCTKIKDL